jgi:hypothetical protein
METIAFTGDGLMSTCDLAMLAASLALSFTAHRMARKLGSDRLVTGIETGGMSRFGTLPGLSVSRR